MLGEVTSSPGAISPAPPVLDAFLAVRSLTDTLAEPLSPEDQTVQSMPDVSPTKWHRAHTTWFFEEFVLAPHAPGYERVHPSFAFLFNSYYEAVGPRQERAARGVITRPSCAEVAAYRGQVDEAMVALLATALPPGVADLVELGLHHEQQHQELLLMDIKHVLAQNVTDPAYRSPAASPVPAAEPSNGVADHHAPASGWMGFEGGPRRIGATGPGFAYDNEGPAHTVWLEPFELATRPVTNAEVLAFIADGGYHRSELWLSDGWAVVQNHGWEAPLYWQPDPDGRFGSNGWSVFTLAGRAAVAPDEPACHLSYFEADALARWLGARLPTEAEWEVAASDRPVTGNLLDPEVLHPRRAPGGPGVQQLFGDVWEWTASAYLPYPGFRPAPGAVGEYNGKFMSGQHVLRGGACVTPPGHVRATYRNFFPPGARWAFSGLRLAREASE
jgi:ergothioneine biosynthesis protein EgtB